MVAGCANSEPTTAQGGDIYRSIAHGVQLIEGECIVGVASVDSSTMRITTRVILGLGNIVESAAILLGRNPSGWSARLPDAAAQQMSTGQLMPLEGGLCGLFFGKVPRGFAGIVEHVFGIKHIYGMGMVHEELLLGSVAIAFRNGKDMQNTTDVERYISASAKILDDYAVQGAPTPTTPPGAETAS